MNKFGTVKSKILQKITEAYAKGDKVEVRNILTTLKKNDDFKGLYLFYENVENKYIEDREDAKLFVNSIIPLLQEKTKAIKSSSEVISEILKDVTVTENKVYDDLDILGEEDTLLNMDKKIIARLRLIEHLVTKKETEESKGPVIENENLLHSILTNNFNVLYSNTLTEEDQTELKNMLSISAEELKTNFHTLKEEVTTKMNKIYEEEKSEDLRSKLNTALTEAEHMKPTKLNYYKLQQLKSGL